jgi:hypothetical protein
MPMIWWLLPLRGRLGTRWTYTDAHILLYKVEEKMGGRTDRMFEARGAGIMGSRDINKDDRIEFDFRCTE